MPSPASLATVLAPIPQMTSGGRSPSSSYQLPEVSRKTPAGLPKPVAILAWSLFSPIPTEQSSRVASLTPAASSRAKASGSAASMPTNASSQPSTSTGAPVSRSTCMTSADTVR